MKRPIVLHVNGRDQALLVEPDTPLVHALRDELGLTGARRGCETSYCGACTVLLDGMAIHSCSILAVAARGQEITTIEGLARGAALHPVQQAFIERGAIQCGYCTPGMILAAVALLNENPAPTEAEVREYLTGNLCRCTGYVKIVDAVLAAGRAMSTEH
jgi:carbon-monoxide dehydrogenase small subunit